MKIEITKNISSNNVSGSEMTLGIGGFLRNIDGRYSGNKTEIIIPNIIICWDLLIYRLAVDKAMISTGIE